MRIWLPYTDARSGSTELVKGLARGLSDRGFDAILQVFPHKYQYVPWLLRTVRPPQGTVAMITNSWNGLAFHTAHIPAVCIEHLFVLDPRLQPYKSTAQSLFHSVFVRHFIEQSYSSATKVVGVSDYTTSQIKKFRSDIEPITIKNGVDTDFFTPGPARHSGERRGFRILFCGNLSKRKGADLLPKILDGLGDGYKLRIAGGTPSDFGGHKHSNMVFLGRLSRDELLAEYRQSDALIAPTRMEGLPLSVLEALSCGLPVVTTDAAALPEAVISGANGFVCGVDRPTEIVASVQALRADGVLHSHMRAAARKIAVDQFSHRRMLDEYAALISALL